MNEQEQLDRGAKAQALLNDPDLASAFDDVKQAIFNAIEQCPLRDDEALHQYRLMLKLLADLRANLEQRIRDGKLTAFRIEEDTQRKTFLGDVKWLTNNRQNRNRP